MPTNKKQIEADLLQYLKSEYDQEFVIESIQWMANEGSSGLPDIHEIVAHPLIAPGLAFGGRVGYNKDKKFFVSFEYYKSVLLAVEANDYAEPVISSYYPKFSSTADLTNIQRVLDDIPPFEDSDYKSIVKEYASQLNTYLYVAVAEDPNEDKSKHYEKLASMFKEYRDLGHLNLGITLGFYKKSAAKLLESDPNSFFKANVPPMQKFQHQDLLIERWSVDLSEKSFKNFDKYLNSFEELVIISKND